MRPGPGIVIVALRDPSRVVGSGTCATRSKWASRGIPRMRVPAAALLVTVALLGAACGGGDGSPSQQDEAPLNEQTPSGQEQGETTPAPAGSERGSGGG